MSQKEISELLAPKFDDNKSTLSQQSDIDRRRITVITTYNPQVYQVEEIMWDLNPKNYTFSYKERDPITGRVIANDNVTLGEYLQKRYNIKLAAWEYNQPLLKLSKDKESIYLLPSRCQEATLPSDFTKDPFKMKKLREYMITEPSHRFERIQELMKDVAKCDLLADWGMKFNEGFSKVTAK